MIMHGQRMQSIVFYSTSTVRWCVLQVLHAIHAISQLWFFVRPRLRSCWRRCASWCWATGTMQASSSDSTTTTRRATEKNYGVDENVDETGQLCRSICISSISSQFASCFTFASQFPSLCGSHVSFRETCKAFRGSQSTMRFL